MKFNTNHITDSKQITQLANGDFLLICESHGDDDSYSTADHWSHYDGYTNDFNFSSNIQVIAATCLLNGCAVVVRKIDPSIPEKFKISDPESGKTIKISF